MFFVNFGYNNLEMSALDMLTDRTPLCKGRCCAVCKTRAPPLTQRLFFGGMYTELRRSRKISRLMNFFSFFTFVNK